MYTLPIVRTLIHFSGIVLCYCLTFAIFEKAGIHKMMLALRYNVALHLVLNKQCKKKMLAKFNLRDVDVDDDDLITANIYKKNTNHNHNSENIMYPS